MITKSVPFCAPPTPPPPPLQPRPPGPPPLSALNYSTVEPLAPRPAAPPSPSRSKLLDRRTDRRFDGRPGRFDLAPLRGGGEAEEQGAECQQVDELRVWCAGTVCKRAGKCRAFVSSLSGTHVDGAHEDAGSRAVGVGADARDADPAHDDHDSVPADDGQHGSARVHVPTQRAVGVSAKEQLEGGGAAGNSLACASYFDTFFAAGLSLPPPFASVARSFFPSMNTMIEYVNSVKKFPNCLRALMVPS